MTKTRYWDRLQEGDWAFIHAVMGGTVVAMFLLGLFILAAL